MLIEPDECWVFELPDDVRMAVSEDVPDELKRILPLPPRTETSPPELLADDVSIVPNTFKPLVSEMLTAPPAALLRPREDSEPLKTTEPVVPPITEMAPATLLAPPPELVVMLPTT